MQVFSNYSTILARSSKKRRRIIIIYIALLSPSMLPLAMRHLSEQLDEDLCWQLIPKAIGKARCLQKLISICGLLARALYRWFLMELPWEKKVDPPKIDSIVVYKIFRGGHLFFKFRGGQAVCHNHQPPLMVPRKLQKPKI